MAADPAVLDLLRASVGRLVALRWRDWDGEIFERRYWILAEPEQHGVLTASGAWALRGGHPGDVPSWRVHAREFRKWRSVWAGLDAVESAEVVG